MNKSLLVLLFSFVLFNYAPATAEDTSEQSERTVYITIDDGPLLGFKNVLSVLTDSKVHATMFMVGQHILASDKHKEDLKLAQDSAYVLIGNHSYSHAHDHYQNFYSDPAGVLYDMRKNNRIIGLSARPYFSRLPGRDVFRTPGLNSDDPFITRREDSRERIDFDELAKAGFLLYGWDLEWAHKTSGEPIQSIARLMKEIKTAFDENRTKIDGHLVLLMHDQMFADHLNGKQNFSNLIKSLKTAGYRLSTIDAYPANR